MKEVLINNIDDFHKRLAKYRKSSKFKFRGHSNVSWDLIPKVGRSQFQNIGDDELFNHWKRRSIAYLPKESYTEWELLAIAQHTGLPTRLLDWTHNPLAAAFFSTVEDFKTDGAIFIYRPNKTIVAEKTKPFSLKHIGVNICFHTPTASSNRVINQLGHFTIHNNPTEALDDSNKDGFLEKLIIPSTLKEELLFMLNQYGINYLSLFPDLEGLSKYLSWFAENNKYWDKNFDVTTL